MKERDLILNPFFLVGLTILIVNDLFLKWHFTGLLTGKLSDFAGLLILPIFIAYLLPICKKYIVFIIGLLFIIWKSPISTGLIDFVNSLSTFQFNRVIDYTDLIALLVLPISHFIINQSITIPRFNFGVVKFLRLLILLISAFAFMATSMIRYELPRGTIYVDKSFKVKMSKDSLLNKINELGYDWKFRKDTISERVSTNRLGYYQIDDVVVEENGQIIDTLKNVKFYLIPLKEDKTKIEIINVELRRPGNIQDWKYLRQMSRFYRGQLKKTLIEPIKE